MCVKTCLSLNFWPRLYSLVRRSRRRTNGTYQLAKMFLKKYTVRQQKAIHYTNKPTLAHNFVK